jgi:hypothetical protein
MFESDGDGAPGKVLGMDWSRRHGDPADPTVDAEWIAGIDGLGLDTNFIVVHGAGICSDSELTLAVCLTVTLQLS